MADSLILSRITKLNSNNYQTWKFKVKLLLTKEDLSCTISEKLPSTITIEWKAKDQKSDQEQVCEV